MRRAEPTRRMRRPRPARALIIHGYISGDHDISAHGFINRFDYPFAVGLRSASPRDRTILFADSDGRALYDNPLAHIGLRKGGNMLGVGILVDFLALHKFRDSDEDFGHLLSLKCCQVEANDRDRSKPNHINDRSERRHFSWWAFHAWL